MVRKQRPNYHNRNGTTRPTLHTTAKQIPIFNLSGKSFAVIVAVVSIIAFGLVFFLFRATVSPKLDVVAYQNKLINVNQGDLPAPPFIGWDQAILHEPPTHLHPNDSISAVNKEECTPGGNRQAEIAWLIMNNATKWSGIEMYNTAHNAHIRIDMSDAFKRSKHFEYDHIDQFLRDCSFVEFNQKDGNDSHRTVRITYAPLDADVTAWGLTGGRVWAQTVSVATPQGFQGTTSTITALTHGGDITLYLQLTFEGRVDDNAIKTMDLLIAAQADKALKT